MRAFLLRKWQRKNPEPTTTISIKRSQDAKSMPRPELPRGEPLDQKQCMLFGKLSPEVRLLIYEEVLADPQRLLHFLHVTPGKGRPHKLGHWRCEDMDSMYLTWQHMCFGVWNEASGRMHRPAYYTNGDLFSILVTCRLMYNTHCTLSTKANQSNRYREAVNVLYTANQFSFRGATGVLSFRRLVAPDMWQRLRSVNLSTTILTPRRNFITSRGSFPRESYLDWEDACCALATLGELRLLRIEMTIWALFAFHDINAGTPEPESLISIFEALKQVHAEVYEVELNVDLPEQVLDALGNIPFRILRLKKQYDRKTFSL